MSRKDFRTDKQFAKDILFSTEIERFFWTIFCKVHLKDFKFNSIDFGTDNSGTITSHSNHNADYKLEVSLNNKTYTILLEIKFGPNSEKLTFKVQDLKAYIKQNACILLFYNTGIKNLKKPKNYNLEKHTMLLLDNLNKIKYTILPPKILQKLLDDYKHEKIYYMGNKLSIIVPKKDYAKYFTGNSLV